MAYLGPMQGWNDNIGKGFVLIRGSTDTASTSKLTEAVDKMNFFVTVLPKALASC